MKILIVSDTHRRDDILEETIRKEKPFDLLIHLGDSEGSELKISNMLDLGSSLAIVQGNNDFFSRLEKEIELKIGKYRALLTHGHLHGVSLGVEQLRREAVSREFTMAMFGHTHKPYYEEKDGIILLNPGSLCYPRQEGRRGSYMVMEVDKDGEIKVDLYFRE
ncbi:MAG: metallophosphoesterase [Johnsonella sp.]|nr:metallophosphoesterase [Johnsonella sp.]